MPARKREEDVMELQTNNAPDVSPEQKATVELVKRIRKLRWIGMEDEADLVQTELALHRFTPVDSVLAMPRDTD
jgi:hypothetical protein